ncbi:glycosyltransferase family 4 protein [Aeoliella mucimassa]|uniref:Alpha-D-kanosaminyltransferase n=1 Tax=Aeoliella mucimassa TaxID=2527972 RepID=A0A518AK56_9BACT|nr:glycosyltransferase family 4 protein [Aeoliella mucimassa]QDU55064.1 Alpha-D-kanosaminyltransferase [Aeoliella mucimassa]
MTSDTNQNLRVAVVAEMASDRMGGEAVLPLHFFRELRRAGVDARLVTHERVSSELQESLGDDFQYASFVKDTFLHRLFFKMGCWLPGRIRIGWYTMTVNTLTQLALCRLVRRLAKGGQIDLVHQPVPVSPRTPSWYFRIGVPVVIGPMNGGMEYPEAFRDRFESRFITRIVNSLRFGSELINVLIPGKRLAAHLLVANTRTQESLPRFSTPNVSILVENGVLEEEVTSELARTSDPNQQSTSFLFVGRLVDWKGVDYLLRAFAKVRQQISATLTIVGNGGQRANLEQLAAELGLADSVEFTGALPRQDCLALMRSKDVFVLSSVLECGGAVVLEAMANGMPVIASDWGGPQDYIDSECGLLVPPTTPEQFEHDFSEAMLKLARNPELRVQLGNNGPQKVADHYTWTKKIEHILQVYSAACKH